MADPNPKKFGPLAGFSLGGGGLGWAAERLNWQWPPAVIYLIIIISIVAFAWSAIASLIWAYRWGREQIALKDSILSKTVIATRRNVIPIMIGACIIASGTLLAVGIAFAFMYRAGSFEPNPPQIVISQTVAPQPMPQQAASVPDPGPEIAKSELQQTARLIKLTGLIKAAESAREASRASGTAIYEWILQTVINDPNYRKSPLGLKGNWPNTLRELQRVNTLAYPNRKIDLDTYPEVNNYLFKAPQQDIFGDDGEKASQYRSYYFLTRHVGKQADALIAQMNEETKILRAEITSAPALSALEGSK